MNHTNTKKPQARPRQAPEKVSQRKKSSKTNGNVKQTAKTARKVA